MSEHTTTAINSNGQDLIVSTCECGRTLTVMLPPLAERVQALASCLASLRYAAPEMQAYWWREIDRMLAALAHTTPQE